MGTRQPYEARDTHRRPWHGLDARWMRFGACNVDLPAAERRKYFADTPPGNATKSQKLELGMDVLEARRRCWTCPVKPECLEYAIEAKMQGVWGDTTEAERKVIIAQRAAAVA